MSATVKLTAYLGERNRVDGRFATEALAELAARHGVATSVVLRGAAGFGLRRHLRTDRLLTLSEDLPLVWLAVDEHERIDPLLRDVEALGLEGLVTLERATLLHPPLRTAEPPGGAAKLTLFTGRGDRASGRAAHEALTALLHAAGAAGTTVLLAVDGTVAGERRRARLRGGNARVPVMTTAVGDAGRLAALLPELGAIAPQAVATLERVTVCRRDGRHLAAPPAVPRTDASGLGIWQMVTVAVDEQTAHEHGPLHAAVLAALREAGAAGATSLRGIWGFHGAHAPHGDVLWRLRRRVPVLTVAIDTPDRVRDWFPVIEALTAETGLVTVETVPAFRAAAAGTLRGGTRLASPRTDAP